MNKETTIEITKERLSKAFVNAMNDKTIKKTFIVNPSLRILMAHINCLIDKELFDE